MTLVRKAGTSCLLIMGLLGCDVATKNTSASNVEAETNSMERSQHINAVETLMASMSLQQKVAQMIQGEIKHVSPDDVRTYGIGSVLNGGGSFPNQDKNASLEDWVALADAYREASLDISEGSAGIPLLWGTDAVHGHNNVVGATIFPHNIGLGAANDPELIGKIGRITSREVAATGIDWIFAPTVAVPLDDRWGRTYEGYSDRPEIVREYAGVIVEALQSEGLLATAKHFIGDGGTDRGVDQGDTRTSLETLLATHGQ
jgi:beta-glucosidase